MLVAFLVCLLGVLLEDTSMTRPLVLKALTQRYF